MRSDIIGGNQRLYLHITFGGTCYTTTPQKLFTGIRPQGVNSHSMIEYAMNNKKKFAKPNVGSLRPYVATGIAQFFCIE